MPASRSPGEGSTTRQSNRGKAGRRTGRIERSGGNSARAGAGTQARERSRIEKGPRRFVVFGVVSLALLFSGLESTAVAVAFPTIRSSFGSSIILAGWVLAAYQLAMTAVLPIAGKISDVWGRRFTYLVCMGLFGLGSFLCAVAFDIRMLIAARVIQAMGGGGLLPSAVGIVSDHFPRTRQRAVALFTSIFPIGMIIGPNLGGWLVQAYGWRAIFTINIPIVLVLMLAIRFLVESDRSRRGSMDFTGAAMLVGALASFMGALSVIGTWWNAAGGVASGLLLGISAGVGFMFYRHERNGRHPILEPVVLTSRPFAAANIYNFIYGASVIGIMSLVPTFAVSVYGFSTLESGLVLTPRSIGMILASALASVFIMKWGYRKPMIVGTALTVACLALLGLQPHSILGLEPPSIVMLSGILLLGGLGMGTSSPASNNACIELMPKRSATITGIRGMFRQCGGAISVTLSSILLNHVSSMSRGFTIIFIAVAVLSACSLPAIMAMPASPRRRKRE